MTQTQRHYLRSTLPQHSLVLAAFDFAADAHESINHRRKYSDEPYIVHPVAVALRVAQRQGTPEMIASALLHDVVEDTPRTIDDVIAEFGEVVGRQVAGLTDVSQLSDGNRAVRKALDAAHTAAQAADVQTIKLADIEHNFHDITAQDRGFAHKWVAEKVVLLSACRDGDPELLATVSKLVEDWVEIHKK
jgi:(p)ppGpp synthase/HD superfamily hydrolase